MSIRYLHYYPGRPSAAAALTSYLAPFAARSCRSQSRASLERYVPRLVSDLTHKICDAIAAAVAGAPTERLQHLLTDSAVLDCSAAITITAEGTTPLSFHAATTGVQTILLARNRHEFRNYWYRRPRWGTGPRLPLHYYRLATPGVAAPQRAGKSRRLSAPPPTRLSAEARDQLVARVAAGETLRAVARDYGISHEQVRRLAHATPTVIAPECAKL